LGLIDEDADLLLFDVAISRVVALLSDTNSALDVVLGARPSPQAICL
jgi:hypothetical protein